MQSDSDYGPRVWVLAVDDPEVGNMYWRGYATEAKDHRWSRNASEAIQFVRECDACSAGVRAYNGLKAVEMEDGIRTGRETKVAGSRRP